MGLPKQATETATFWSRQSRYLRIRQTRYESGYYQIAVSAGLSHCPAGVVEFLACKSDSWEQMWEYEQTGFWQATGVLRNLHSQYCLTAPLAVGDIQPEQLRLRRCGVAVCHQQWQVHARSSAEGSSYHYKFKARRGDVNSWRPDRLVRWFVSLGD